jgi:hypothetical protein
MRAIRSSIRIERAERCRRPDALRLHRHLAIAERGEVADLAHDGTSGLVLREPRLESSRADELARDVDDHIFSIHEDALARFVDDVEGCGR